MQARVEQLRRGFERQLAALEEDVLGSLDAARAPLTHAVDAARSMLEVVQGQVGALSSAATQATTALGGQVATLRDTGDALAARLASSLAAGLAAISAVPVDALPPMLTARANIGLSLLDASKERSLTPVPYQRDARARQGTWCPPAREWTRAEWVRSSVPLPTSPIRRGRGHHRPRTAEPPCADADDRSS